MDRGLASGMDRDFSGMVGGLMENANPLLYALLVDGIIGGVGAVVGFLPLVMVMYFLIALLEDCGYMARATVVLDPIFKRVGLSGKSVIPMVIGTGCAIPGVMACRTIRNERERRTTAMLTPFMPMWGKNPSDCSVCRCILCGRMVGFSNHVSGGYSLSFAWSFTCEKDYRTKIQENLFLII